MKVIHLKAENFLRLRAVEITPKGAVVKVSGANGEGKTSTLDAIYAALDHRRVAAAEPIHRGAKKAVIKLDLGEIVVERVITQKSTELKVTAADGSRIASPQKFLDAMLGELSFDPLAFDRMRPLDQVEQLRRCVKVDFDFAANAAERQRLFDRRTELNRDAKQRRSQAEGLPAGGPGVPVNEKSILDEMEQVHTHNTALDERRLKRQSHEQHITAYKAAAERSREEIARLKMDLAREEANLESCLLEVGRSEAILRNAPPLPEPKALGELRASLERAQAHNRLQQQAQQRTAYEAEAAKLEHDANELSEKIDALDKAKQAAVAQGIPVPGIGIADDMVLYNGFPYAQASAAERLRVSMAIAMAANPKVRVIRISDGSLLDTKSMGIIGEMAAANDFQVWVEVVDESKQIGIVIEDGAVAAVNE